MKRHLVVVSLGLLVTGQSYLIGMNKTKSFSKASVFKLFKNSQAHNKKPRFFSVDQNDEEWRRIGREAFRIEHEEIMKSLTRPFEHRTTLYKQLRRIQSARNNIVEWHKVYLVDLGVYAPKDSKSWEELEKSFKEICKNSCTCLARGDFDGGIKNLFLYFTADELIKTLSKCNDGECHRKE
jgi:hypothetical protein